LAPWPANCTPTVSSPYLSVTSKHSATLSKHILCQRAPDQDWQFCWTWQQPIGPASDPAAAGRRLVTAVPGIRQAARDNRAFLARVTCYLAAEAGITQFIDIGSGLPGPGPVHEIAREAQPAARVAYVDHDPVVIAHARAVLADSPLVTAAEADLRYPRSLLTTREIRDLIDLDQPVAVLLVAVLHFIPDDAGPLGIVKAITARLAPGSYVAVTHGTPDHLDPGTAMAARAAYDGASAPGVPRSRDDIERFLDGLELIPPGITDVTAWRPGPGRPRLRSASPPVFYGGAGRVPAR
jgi:trans-aconitate methyltransferase